MAFTHGDAVPDDGLDSATLHSLADPRCNGPPETCPQSAALAGLAVAALGIWASHRWQLSMLDGVASLVIGMLLAGVAVLLVRESRGLLIGEGIRASTAAEVGRIVRSYEGVVAASQPLSMYIGRHEVLLAMDLQFARHTSATVAARTIDSIEGRISQRFPVIKRIYIVCSMTLIFCVDGLIELKNYRNDE